MKRIFCVVAAILAIVIVSALLSLNAVEGELKTAQQLTQSLQSEIDTLSEENAKIEAQSEKADSDEALEAMARAKLGLVKGDEIIFIYKN